MTTQNEDKYERLKAVLKQVMDEAIEKMGVDAASKISFCNIDEKKLEGLLNDNANS